MGNDLAASASPRSQSNESTSTIASRSQESAADELAATLAALVLLEALSQAENNVWDSDDCSSGMDVIEGGRIVKKKLSLLPTTVMVRAKRGFDTGIHVWEICWPSDERGSHAVIGVASTQTPLTCLGYTSLCGATNQSLGWDIARNELVFSNRVIRRYPDGKIHALFRAPEVIRVILNMNEGLIVFKSGSEEYGVALRGLRSIGKKLYPAVSTAKDGARIAIKHIGSTD